MLRLTRQQVRQIDQTAIEHYGMSGLVLMENAGRGAAEAIHRIAPSGDLVVLCGKGNNAGDGYVIARHLDLMNRTVKVVSVVPLGSLTGDAAANANIAVRAGLDIEVVEDPAELEATLGSAAILVDCLLGTGATGDPQGVYADAVRTANAADAIRIAIDIPTGLDVDTGVPGEPTFQADATLTFVAEKTGFATKEAREFLGIVEVISIGIPKKMLPV
ncbi:NAD(P)H-hydrate epimerase [Novipirellula artificiosorum]|uniref:NAD(P)H-hydrate epimerase n=1 Tax=Novipirellula artificiosorum TaxID=2528016 RepID=A0A5C6DEG7_9BACT|nr:NAD(P)H-hydrate epimerase [Novipirellula artificiosorum]TWU35058.1 Bifunctional NAD(P)H-hydrate repair enzyme Nnr [Novipirellula artificiosorum]